MPERPGNGARPAPGRGAHTRWAFAPVLRAAPNRCVHGSGAMRTRMPAGRAAGPRRQPARTARESSTDLSTGTPVSRARRRAAVARAGRPWLRCGRVAWRDTRDRSLARLCTHGRVLARARHETAMYGARSCKYLIFWAVIHWTEFDQSASMRRQRRPVADGPECFHRFVHNFWGQVHRWGRPPWRSVSPSRRRVGVHPVNPLGSSYAQWIRHWPPVRRGTRSAQVTIRN